MEPKVTDCGAEDILVFENVIAALLRSGFRMVEPSSEKLGNCLVARRLSGGHICPKDWPETIGRKYGAYGIVGK